MCHLSTLALHAPVLLHCEKADLVSRRTDLEFRASFAEFLSKSDTPEKVQGCDTRVVRISHFTAMVSKLCSTIIFSQGWQEQMFKVLTYTTPREFLVHWLCIGSLRGGGGKVLSGKVPFAFALRFSFTAQSDPATLLSPLPSPNLSRRYTPTSSAAEEKSTDEIKNDLKSVNVICGNYSSSMTKCSWPYKIIASSIKAWFSNNPS